MPLAFNSTTHGTIAFGFFNIDSDMLLLENRFFFATSFCNWLIDLGDNNDEELSAVWPVMTIDRQRDVGDLMGAIRGYRHTGFIGDTYLKYPFPKAPEDFKQRPQGDRVQAEFAGMISKYAREEELPLVASASKRSVSIGDVVFHLEDFHELIRYVLQGGYPRWLDEVKPQYVLAMKERLEASDSWLFAGIDWKV